MALPRIDDSSPFPSVDELKARGVRNILPELPLAPCVKSISNSRIYVWHPVWAMRPDAFVCCDENGDEDPAAWRGRAPQEQGPSLKGDSPPTGRDVRKLEEMRKEPGETGIFFMG